MYRRSVFVLVRSDLPPGAEISKATHTALLFRKARRLLRNRSFVAGVLAAYGSQISWDIVHELPFYCCRPPF